MIYNIVRFLSLSVVFNSIVFSAPLAGLQFCGKDLADTLAEVCSGRGYNVAFWPDVRGNDRRPKRGIVDECCRRFCTWSTLETYCSPVTSSPSPFTENLSIRKRNGFTEKLKIVTRKTEHETSRLAYSLPEVEDMTTQTRHHRRKLFAHTDSETAWQGSKKRIDSQYRSSHTNYGQGTYINNKVKRNDPSGIQSSLEDGIFNSLPDDISMNDALIDTEEILAELADPKIAKDRIRHPRTHSNRGLKLKENSQIGTVAPYFLGRTLVLPSSRKSRLPHY